LQVDLIEPQYVPCGVRLRGLRDLVQHVDQWLKVLCKLEKDVPECAAADGVSSSGRELPVRQCPHRHVIVDVDEAALEGLGEESCGEERQVSKTLKQQIVKMGGRGLASLREEMGERRQASVLRTLLEDRIRAGVHDEHVDHVVLGVVADRDTALG